MHVSDYRSVGPQVIPPGRSSGRSFGWYTLRAKLVIAFMVVALIPLSLLFYLDNRYTRVTLTDNANQALLAAASQTALRVDSFINNNLNDIGTEAQLPDFIKYLSLPPDRREGSAEEAEATSALYALSRKDQANISSYALLDRRGLTVIDTFTPDIGTDGSNYDYFQLAVKTGVPYASPVQFSETGEASIYFSAPVRDTAAGEIIGVLYARYSASALEQIIVQSGELAGRQSFAILLDENHIRLAHGTDPDLIFKAVTPLDPVRAAELQAARRLPRQPIKELATDLPAFEQGLLNADKQPYFTAYLGTTDSNLNSAAVTRLITQPWLIVFVQPQAVFLASVQTHGRTVLLLGLGVAAVVLVAATGMARLLTGPVVHLTAVARQVAEGNLDAKAQVESKDEIGVLAEAFNLMTGRLVETLEGLRASEEDYRVIFENAVEGIYRISVEGRPLSANPAMAHILGFDSPDELVANTVDVRQQSYVHPEDRDSFLAAILERGTVLGREFQFYRKNKQIIWVSINARLVRDDAGTPLFIEGFTTDITERKRAEEIIRQNEARLSEAADMAQLGYWEFDYQTQVFTVTDQLWAMFRTTAEEQGGYQIPAAQYVQKFVHPDDAYIVGAEIQKGAESTEPDYSGQVEFRIIRADGSEGFNIVRYRMIKDEQGRSVKAIGIGQDITERKRAEQEIQKLNEELEQRVLERTAQLEAAIKELETVSYTVSHNMRAPLRHIDGFLELLQKRTATTLDEQSQRYMTTISDAARHMGLLVDGLLTFLRMRRNEISKVQVNLNDLAHEVIRDLTPETAGRKINWHIALLPTVTGDQTMLRQVLVNLFSNALKFTRECESTEIEIGCRTEETETIIFIRDNGVGFDMAYADKLFGVFQRLHHADEFEGTGIGLANVRRIIKRHNGRTWAEGQVNQGAVFYFSLPQVNQKTGGT